MSEQSPHPDEHELPPALDAELYDLSEELDQLPPEACLTPSPDHASDYVPPQVIPSPTDHKTIEVQPVRVDPELIPTRAKTVMSVRRQASAERVTLPAMAAAPFPNAGWQRWLVLGAVSMVVAGALVVRRWQAESVAAPTTDDVLTTSIEERGKTAALAPGALDDASREAHPHANDDNPVNDNAPGNPATPGQRALEPSGPDQTPPTTTEDERGALSGANKTKKKPPPEEPAEPSEGSTRDVWLQ